MVEYAYKENGVMKLKPVAMSLSQSEIDEIATELLEAMQPDWQNAISISVTSSYTVPADGMIVGIIGTTAGSTADGYLQINGISAARIERQTNFTKDGGIQCIVNKGDVVVMSGINPTWQNIHFVPFKTRNPVSLRPLDPHKIDASVVQHWDDITSDFSTTGSTAGIVLNYVKYNPVLRMLKYKVTRNQTTAANSTEKHELIYNGSDMIAFNADSTILFESINFISTITAGYEVSSKIMSSNHIEVNAYNRNGGNTWESGHYFTGVIYL